MTTFARATKLFVVLIIFCVAANAGSAAKPVRVAVGTRQFQAELPSKAVATFLIPAE